MKPRLLIYFLLFSTTLFAGDFRGGDIHIQQYTALSVQANINVNLIIHSEIENILICWGDGSCDILGNPQVLENSSIDTKTLHFFWVHEYNQSGTYQISIGECCWANDIFNMNLTSEQAFTIETTFKLTNPQIEPFNVMPYSQTLPLSIGNMNQAVLVYNSLVNIPETDESTFEICEVDVDNYFLLEEIFTQQIPFFLDPLTGGFNWFSPPTFGFFIVKVCITTTRGGEVISQTSRDILIAIDKPLGQEQPENSNNLGLKCYPNPAQNVIQLEYDLSKSSIVEIDLFNISGKQIKSLCSSEKIAGNNKESFDISDLPSGSYFLKITTENQFGIIPFIKKQN